MSSNHTPATSDGRQREKNDGSRHLIEELGDPWETDNTLRESVRLKNNSSLIGDNHDLSTVTNEPKFLFVCGRCDMLVSEEDQRCKFCGAEFLTPEEMGDEPPIELDDKKCYFEEGEINPEEETNLPFESIEELISDYQWGRSETPAEISRISFPQRTKRVDVISMFNQGLTKLGTEHLSGATNKSFSYSSKLLRKLEICIEQAAEFGADISKAQKLLVLARKAFNEGNWNKAVQIGEKAKRVLAPDVICLVKGQISCLREAMIEMKHKGKVLAPFIIEIKTIQRALRESRLDDAIKMTRNLISTTRKAQMEMIDEEDREHFSHTQQIVFCGEGI